MRAFQARAILGTATVGLLALCASSAAGEPPADGPGKRGQTDAERAVSVLRAMRAPETKDDFVFECEMRSADSVLGEGLFEARAGTEGGQPVWVVTEEARIPKGAFMNVQRTRAQISQDLRVLRIERAEDFPPRPKSSVTAERIPKGFAITEPLPAPEAPRKTTIDAAPETTSSFSAIVLFLRTCPSEPTTYEIPYFSLGNKRVTTARIAVKGPGTLDVEGRAVPAWVAGVDPDPDIHVDFYFDPTGRGLLALVMPQRGLTFAKKGLFASKAPPPLDASKPASSAKDAGLRFAVGLLSGDLELAKSAIDFEVMRTLEKVTDPLPEFTSKFVVQRLQPQLKSFPRAQAEAFARSGLVGAAEVKKPDGATSVAFGPALPNLRYEALQRKDGTWRIVRLVE